MSVRVLHNMTTFASKRPLGNAATVQHQVLDGYGACINSALVELVVRIVFLLWHVRELGHIVLLGSSFEHGTERHVDSFRSFIAERSARQSSSFGGASLSPRGNGPAWLGT